MKNLFTVIDLFAGAGGFSQGFLLVKGIRKGVPAFKIIKAVELDEVACKTLRVHLSKQDVPVDNVVLNGDLENEDVKNKIIKECPKADVIIGGPPCQTFSLAGPARCGKIELRQKLQNDSRNNLYKHYIEIVEKIKPGFVVFENVEGIISKKAVDEVTGEIRRVIDIIIKRLQAIGYNTTIKIEGVEKDYLILNAADYGVPQFRKRVIIIANRLGIPNPFPNPVCGSGTGKPYRTVACAIHDLPVVLPPINTVRFEKIKNLELVARHPSEYLYYFVKAVGNLAHLNREKPAEDKLIRLASVIKKSYRKVENCRGNRLKALRDFVEEYNENLNGLDGKMYDQDKFPALHISRPHNIRDVCIFARMKPGTNSAQFMKEGSKNYDKFLSMIYPYSSENHKDTYVRQSWQLPSTTILSHMNRDGLKFIHPEQPRTFTPCEAALLQSFSFSSKFHGTRSDMYLQIGNAVPPLLAQAIAEAIYSALISYYSRLDIREQAN